MIKDETYVYWHLRPSGRYPTLELRVADVALGVEGAVALAALFRALVRTGHGELGGRTPELPGHEAVRAATWRACRYGLEGPLIDLVRAEEVAAPELVGRLLEHVRPSCVEYGDWDEVSQRVEAVLARGNGAQRQRRALLETGSLREVTRMIVEQTDPTTASVRLDDASSTGASA
jgi:glutamate---cysteine ligase / carboxylate-amine ligase